MDQTAESIKRGYLSEDFRVFHIRDSLGTHVENHYHEFYKVILILSGSGEYTIRGLRYALAGGDIILVGAQTAHKPDFEEGILYERIVFFISEEFLSANSTADCDLRQIFRHPSGFVLRPKAGSGARFTGPALTSEKMSAEKRFGSSILSRTSLVQLLVEIGREQSGGRAGSAPLLSRDRKMGDLLRYIDAHLTEDLTIDELADRFYISKYHMMRRFKEEIGTSIHRYIADKRLFYARSRMLSGSSATEACFEAGFGSYSAFARAYRSFFSCSPTESSEKSGEAPASDI